MHIRIPKQVLQPRLPVTPDQSPLTASISFHPTPLPTFLISRISMLYPVGELHLSLLQSPPQFLLPLKKSAQPAIGPGTRSAVMTVQEIHHRVITGKSTQREKGAFAMCVGRSLTGT